MRPSRGMSADERQDVMLAHGVERDVAHDDKLLVALLVELFAQMAGRIVCQAREELLARAGDAVRSAHETRTVRVLANADEQLADGGLDARPVDAGDVAGLAGHRGHGGGRYGDRRGLRRLGVGLGPEIFGHVIPP